VDRGILGIPIVPAIVILAMLETGVVTLTMFETGVACGILVKLVAGLEMASLAIPVMVEATGILCTLDTTGPTGIATDLGTGSVGNETARVVLVGPLGEILAEVGWFCSSSTGCVFLTVSGGRGWVGS